MTRSKQPKLGSQAGMSMVEVIVAIGILGVAALALLQGQQFVAQVARAHDQKVTLWSIERQFQTQVFGRVRDVLHRSIDDANNCKPCETSLGTIPGRADGSSCRPIPKALQMALSAFKGSVRLYSTQLSLVSSSDPLPQRVSGYGGFVEQGYQRCQKSSFTSTTRFGSAESVYACFHIRAAKEDDPTGKAIAAKQLGRRPKKPIETSKSVSVRSEDEKPKRDLELFLEDRLLFAEVHVGLKNHARGSAVSCNDFRFLEAGDRGLTFYYTIYSIDETKPQGFDQVVRLRGSFSARSDR